MIRILTYKEHPHGKAILDRYLYLAAYTLPFSPEDVLWDNELEIDGMNITAVNFFQESKKTPRRRTKKYLALLKDHHIIKSAISGAASQEQQREQDQLLAAKLIWSASRNLYTYLYQTDNPNIEPTDMPPVQRDHLRTLLTVKMDELPTDLARIGAVNGTVGQTLLDEVFRYSTFAAHPAAAQMLKIMDVNVCPYCNRLYTMTLIGNEGKSRPQFDHYKSKSQYPYFAVSIMNLIPSCGLCNQSKGDSEGPVLYPYSDEMGNGVVFRTKAKTGFSYLTGCQNSLDEFNVVLDIVDNSLPKDIQAKVHQSDVTFQLTHFYNLHKDYILYLFWKNYVFSDEYLETLCKTFNITFASFQEVKSMMYLMDIDKEQWGRRPLAKLTHDIDIEISELG